MKYRKYKMWWDTFKIMCVLKPMYAQINETDLDNVYTELSGVLAGSNTNVLTGEIISFNNYYSILLNM